MEQTDLVFQRLVPALLPSGYKEQEVFGLIRTWSLLAKKPMHGNILPQWFETLRQWEKNSLFSVPVELQLEEPFYKLGFMDRIFLFSIHHRLLSIEQWAFAFAESNISILTKQLLDIRRYISLLYELQPPFAEGDQKLTTECLDIEKLLHVIDGWQTWKNPNSWSDFLHLSRCTSCLDRTDKLRKGHDQITEILPSNGAQE